MHFCHDQKHVTNYGMKTIHKLSLQKNLNKLITMTRIEGLFHVILYNFLINSM